MTYGPNKRMTDRDSEAVQSFKNFLSWGERPSIIGIELTPCRDVPPAWWAYALGATTYCPPSGEM